MKVYTVESGEYSDFRVHAYFTDKALAERWCDYYNRRQAWGGDHVVEEHDVETDEPRPTVTKWGAWRENNYVDPLHLPPRSRKYKSPGFDVRSIAFDLGESPRDHVDWPSVLPAGTYGQLHPRVRLGRFTIYRDTKELATKAAGDLLAQMRSKENELIESIQVST